MPDDRTLPDDPRTRLAGERTLLAWVRTAVALMGLGFVVARFGLFLRELAAARGVVDPASRGASLWIGVLLIALGVGTCGFAAWDHARFLRQIERAIPYRPPRRPLSIIVAVLLGLVGILLAAYLLVLHPDG